METFLLISNIGLWIFVAVQLVVIFMLTKLITQFLNRFRTDGSQVGQLTLKAGMKAPLFREEDQHGTMVKLAEHQGEHSLLLFTKQGCSICQELITHLPHVQQAHPNLRLLVISGESEEETQKQVPAGVHHLRSRFVMSNYHIEKVPAAVLINPEGQILANETLSNANQLLNIIKVHFRQAS